MGRVYTSKHKIIDALDKITKLADDETWSGTPADEWMTDLHGHVSSAKAALGDPLDDSVQDCYEKAQQLKANSAREAAGAT